MCREVPVHGRPHCQHQAAGGGAPRPSGGGYLGCLLCGAGSSSCNVISCGGEEAIMKGLCGFPRPCCSSLGSVAPARRGHKHWSQHGRCPLGQAAEVTQTEAGTVTRPMGRVRQDFQRYYRCPEPIRRPKYLTRTPSSLWVRLWKAFPGCLSSVPGWRLVNPKPNMVRHKTTMPCPRSVTDWSTSRSPGSPPA